MAEQRGQSDEPFDVTARPLPKQHQLIGRLCTCGKWWAGCGNDVTGKWHAHVVMGEVSERSDEKVSVFDLVKKEERLVHCSWCAAQAGSPCTEWDAPIDGFHDQRRAHLLDLRIALVAPALEEAGGWLAQQRQIVSGRRYANAEMFGMAIHARGEDLRWRAERELLRLRLRNTTSRPGKPAGDADA